MPPRLGVVAPGVQGEHHAERSAGGRDRGRGRRERGRGEQASEDLAWRDEQPRAEVRDWCADQGDQLTSPQEAAPTGLVGHRGVAGAGRGGAPDERREPLRGGAGQGRRDARHDPRARGHHGGVSRRAGHREPRGHPDDGLGLARGQGGRGQGRGETARRRHHPGLRGGPLLDQRRDGRADPGPARRGAADRGRRHPGGRVGDQDAGPAASGLRHDEAS
mmetsp:Transcript_10312/g.25807  ORF Transcript_10312/g.25807 Transcript_10312/m.25807 type:complete len:219 (+) Transcript_10312:407-1063(+)